MGEPRAPAAPEYTRVGLTETEVTQRASDEATVGDAPDARAALSRPEPALRGAHAGYRGQIGRGSAIPHALANNVVFQPGDVLVTGASAAMWGYLSELERTMVIGPPSDEQRRMFDHMVALQDTAFDAIKPGARCSDVDRAVRAYFDRHDLMPYWRHHTGHAIGLRYHEGPFLDTGDDTEIVPGMVFTVEPGLYSPELGGFRHSDTAVVTEDGIELVTYYPRDLESLVSRSKRASNTMKHGPSGRAERRAAAAPSVAPIALLLALPASLHRTRPSRPASA